MTGGSWLAKLLTGAVEGPTLPPILSVLAFLLGQLPLGLAPTTRKEKAVQGDLAVPRSSSWVPGHPWLEGSLQREASVEADMEPRGATGSSVSGRRSRSERWVCGRPCLRRQRVLESVIRVIGICHFLLNQGSESGMTLSSVYLL